MSTRRMMKPHDRSTGHSILAYHTHCCATHLHTCTLGLSHTRTHAHTPPLCHKHAQFTLHDNLIPISPPSLTLIFLSHLPPPSPISHHSKLPVSPSRIKTYLFHKSFSPYQPSVSHFTESWQFLLIDSGFYFSFLFFWVFFSYFLLRCSWLS